MLSSVAGLIACAALYLSVIYGSVWIGKRRIEWAARRGVTLAPEPAHPSVGDIWTRHGVDMTVIYGFVFLALALAGFPIWQRVGIAALASLFFTYCWIANSPKIGLDIASPARRAASTVGYWSLWLADWFGYLGLLCFGTALLVEVF